MRDMQTADWAFGIRGAIENIVRANFPKDLRNWPLLQGFDFEGYLINDQYFVMVLKDKLSGIPSGPGIPKPFPFSDHPPLPPGQSDVELWQYYLREKFKLRNEDLAVLLPVHDSGKSNAAEDFKLFSVEERYFWDQQLTSIITRYKIIIQSTMSSKPASVTYNVSGVNTRVNINSTDSSTNVVNYETHEVFIKLREALDQVPEEKQREIIKQTISEMESSVGTSAFVQHYRQFMSCIADHITIFTPYLPILAGLLA